MSKVPRFRTVVLHSYKGGTGKTQIAANLALIWALKGWKVCLLDYDFRAPSVGTLFGIEEPKHWINDYLMGRCEIDQTLVEMPAQLHGDGRLLLGLANPSIKAAEEMVGQNENAQLNSLRRTIKAQELLPSRFDIDYLVIDTSPGPQYSSLNAVFAASVLLILMKRDKTDIMGTARMLEDVYCRSSSEKRILVNMLPPGIDPNSVRAELEKRLKTPIIGIIPCYCDLSAVAGESLFALEQPNHGFVEALRKISEESIFRIDR
ncbi:MinD/ParA family protein [Candidatus Bathyarchaeota archaeon]|nr:MinD/ParA family protein [Candidatus Bathyarchaeota archaeon]